MSLRSLTPRQISTWSDAIFRAALEERPLPAGHPLSWDALHHQPGQWDTFAQPVFSDPSATALAEGIA